ncbi:hypothetical protein PSECIP111951_03245 [Pseudoalteromonas holothuriae]|uniref:DUF4142 domain-containing protein n=1 Tax=Pseudoalteromonas holothuriae TaxID=2963714 RepID=A0ABN8UPJ6_9GAMM|nr:hypothetical protein [Pseudoalteromonas sp. CIP111951]CAH9064896.1 hypothetical protein PSECIP111951_03245 [Pseudoalteromonas sp. CIP111951]
MSNRTTESNKTQIIADKSLAQTGALAVQDAATNMRDMNALLSTASGAALAKFIEQGDVKYLQALEDLNKQTKTSTDHFIDLFNSVTNSQNKQLDDESNKTQIIADKSLAQTGALAVQDAANNMRDMNTLLSTASGVALANFIEHGDVKYLQALEDLNKQTKISTDHFIDLFNSVTNSQNKQLDD